ncbi:MAG: hypothetical protein ACRDRZ_13140 [Pseudonocardiaceae bacterium]
MSAQTTRGYLTADEAVAEARHLLAHDRAATGPDHAVHAAIGYALLAIEARLGALVDEVSFATEARR